MTTFAQPTLYQVRVRGHLEERWLRWFEGLVIDPEPEGETLIQGEMDQAALHGILNTLLDLGVVLISVQRLDQPDKNQAGKDRSLSTGSQAHENPP